MGVYVHFSNHDGPQDPGHAQKSPGTTVGPSTTPHGHRPRQRVSSQRETPHSLQAALFPRAAHGKTFRGPWTDAWLSKQLSFSPTEADSAIQRRRNGCHGQPQCCEEKRSHERKEVWEGDTQPMGNPFPLPSHQGHPGTGFQERNPCTAIQMLLAKWLGEAVGMPGIGEVRDPNPCPCGGWGGGPEPSFHGAQATMSSPSSGNPREEKGSQTGWIDMAEGIPVLGKCNGSTSSSAPRKGVLNIHPQHMSVSALPRQGVTLERAAPGEKRRAEGLRGFRPDGLA